MKKLPVLFLLYYLLGNATAWGQKAMLTNVVNQTKPNAAPGFALLTSHFHQYVDKGVLAGTVIIVGKGDQLYKDHYGMQNMEAEIPMSFESIFRLASMTKPIVSVALMTLVEEGKISLDDPIVKFIPGFKNLKVYQSENELATPKTALTLRHLLSHTGGITSGFDDSPAGQICAEMMREKKPGSLEEIINVLAETPLAFHPGEGWAYSYSTDVLAYVIEQVTGERIDQFLTRKVLKPLKMNDTGFQVPPEKINRFTALYATGEDGKLTLADNPKDSPYTNGQQFPRGNGGLTSTPLDYFRFAQMLLNGGELDGVRILKKETIEMMATNVVPEEHLPIRIGGKAVPGYGFGLGFGVLVGDPPFGSAGDFFWPGAAFTYFFINPKEGTCAVFMTQLSDRTKMNLIGEFHGLASGVFQRR
ncbi:MAG: serine hydrolase domain-containing protein [Saprospiraceae bacterium]